MAEDVMAGAQMHAMQLLMSMDAYAAGDYDMAFSKQREGTMHVEWLATLLTQWIVQQFPEMFEHDMMK